MPYENVEIIERPQDVIVVMDRPNGGSWFEMYSGIQPSRSRATRLAIVFATRKRADAFLENEAKRHENAQYVTVQRSQSFQSPPARLRGCVMLHDRYVRLNDDAVLKRRYPVPDGIDVSFRWEAKEQVYRLEARTERNGALTTRTVTLPSDAKDFGERVAAAYARFKRTSPAPVMPSGVKCGTHLAGLLIRLDRPAAAEYAHWLARVRKLPLHERSDAGPLLLPGAPLDATMASIRLDAVKGRDEITGKVTYKGANAIMPGHVIIADELPATVLEALRGRTADVLWGSSDHSEIVIGRRVEDAVGTNMKKMPRYEISYPLVPAPDVDGVDGDDARAERVLERNYVDHSFERTLTRSLTALAPTWLLHLLRTLHLAAVNGMDGVDAGYIPGCEAERLVLENGKHIKTHVQARDGLNTLWRRAGAMAA